MASTLGPEWHISSDGVTKLTENGCVKEKHKIYELTLNTDLKEICYPVLSDELSKDKTSKIVLQIQKIRNISAPKANEESQAAPRMLKLSLTDGDSYVQALEIDVISSISRSKTPPGTKILVNNAKIISGYLLLSPGNCTVLGGRVPMLVEKWEIAKSVQRNHRVNTSDDGPPPWVNFGNKIQSSIQETNFKSLASKIKDSGKDNSEFELQRQGAIAEAASGAAKKVFSGRVSQNIQPAKPKEYSKDKRDQFRNKGKITQTEMEFAEKPQKPSERVSLFAFLEDKLPINDAQTRSASSEIGKSQAKFQDYRQQNQETSFNKTIHKQDEKPYCSKNYPDQKETQKSNQKTEVYPKIEVKQQKRNAKSYISFTQNNFEYRHSPKEFNTNISNHSQQSQKLTTDYKFMNQNSSSNFYETSQQSQPKFRDNKETYSGQKSNSTYEKHNSTKSNRNNYGSQPEPPDRPTYKPNENKFQNTSHHKYDKNINHNSSNMNSVKPQGKIHQIVDEINTFENAGNLQNENNVVNSMERMSLNSQFASRSLRQHLNLGTSKKNEEPPSGNNEKSPKWNVGDECLAKYWEDGKFYNASITAITDKTFAVRFKGYGNIEEILKTDCLPIRQNSKAGYNNQNTKPYSGSVEFRRSSRNHK